MDALPPIFTVRDAMAICGLPDNPNVLFQGQTVAERVAVDVFNDDFASSMDKTFEELDADFKSYSDLTAAQGQIRMVPGVKTRIKAFVQWVRDEVRYGRNPALAPFPVANAALLIRRYKTHMKFVKDSSTISDAAKPKQLTEGTKWEDWLPTFLNYLRLIPGRDGVPLKYVCRDNDAPDPTPHADFLDDYVAMAPLAGEAFTIDAATVHTLLLSFIAGNSTAENKIQARTAELNGRVDFQALKAHYEGVGVLSFDITEADRILKKLFYAGEKRPTMWWDQFELQLTRAFTAYDKKERRQVHSNEMKLRILLEKVDADFLKDTKAGLNIALTEIPMTMTYERALAAFRNQVNLKFPPQMGQPTHVRRQINEVSGRGRNFARGNGRGGRGRGGRGSSQRSAPPRTRADSEIITLTDGSRIEYHPSFKFPPHVFSKFTQSQIDRLKRERAEYKTRRRDQATIQELRSQLFNPNGSQGQPQQPPNHVDADQASQISQVTGTTMMGGRNEQANLRQQNRRISTVKTIRHVRSASASSQCWRDPPANTVAPNETDSNADTCCLGKNFLVVNVMTRMADVYAYDKSIAPIENVPTLSGATAYDDPVTGETYILVFHESLYYGTRLDHSLINPNQVRQFGIPYWDNPFDFERGLGIHVDDGIRIPLCTQGTKVFFNTRVPTQDELINCHHIDMTSRRPWNPADIVLQQVGTSPSNPQLQGTDTPILEADDYDLLCSVDPSLVDLHAQLNRCRRISETNTLDMLDVPVRRTFVSHERHTKVTADSLADRFCVGTERAKNTIRVTTQRGVRSAILPISRRYRADRYLTMKRLQGKFATDTAFATIKSLRGNVASQIYMHKCGFKQAYHLCSVNGDSIGHTLGDFANDFGAPEHLTFDGASVQVGSKTRFMELIRRMEIRYHVSAPRRPNENPAEAGIHELKKRWYRIMTKKRVPKRLWDFGFDWVCETGNVMWNSSRYCRDRTPLEVITGETPDITEYLDFGFYDW